MTRWARMRRVVNVFRAGRVERELDDELRFHVEARVDELMRGGVSRAQAEAQAGRQFGNRLRLREASRDVKLVAWLESLLKDVRFGLRVLRKEAVVSGAAVASLALAIGACTAAFSLIDALILRPLPVREPLSLAYLTYQTGNPNNPEGESFSYPAFTRLRDAARPHADLFAMSTQVMRPVTFPGGSRQEEQVRTQFVSGDAFPILGLTPAVGRLIAPADDLTPGNHPVAVLSHAFWMRRFGGDPAIVGRTFTFRQREFQIIGVGPAGFAGVEPGRLTDVWVPQMMYDARSFTSPEFNWFRIMGRLKPGVRIEALQPIVQASFTNARREFAKGMRPDAPRPQVERYINTPLHVRTAANGPSPLRREFQRPLWILAIVVTFVLLIATSNVANLLLARAAAREREISLRLSIGAGRARLIQQLLVESGLLAGLACALGVVIAMAAGPLVVRMLAPAADPAYLELRLSWRLLAFTGGLGLLTTVLFGLAPALRASRVAPMGVLQRASGGRLTSRLGLRPLVAAQVAFSLIVLFVASLLLLSFGKLLRVDPGFAPDRLVVVGLAPHLSAAQALQDPAARRAAALQLVDHLRTLPGVEDAALSGFAIFGGGGWTGTVRVDGREVDREQATIIETSPGFFTTMRMRLLQGRALTTQDVEQETPTAAVVNEAFARRYFRSTHVVGRHFERLYEKGHVRHEIVGIVANAKYDDLRQAAPPTMYLPMRGMGRLYVRTTGDPLAVAPILRQEVTRIQAAVRVTDITLQTTLIANTLLRERLLALLSGFFAAVGLLLAAIGLYGVLSYAVAQRTREIGIRVALGARPLTVVRSVLMQVVWMMTLGIVVGLSGGLFLSRFVKSLLYEVQPTDAWSIAVPIVGLLLAALLAAVPPARRAARMDPMAALRHD